MNKITYSSLFIRNIFIKLLSFIKSLIVLPFLTPAELGIYRYALSILSYSSYFHFGSITQLLFRYSELKDNPQKLEQAKQLALYGVYLGSLISIIVAIYFLPKEFTVRDRIIIGIVSSSSLISLYTLLLLRVRLKFYEMARADIISQIVSFIFVLIGMYIFGLLGLIVGGQIGLFYLLLKYRSELLIKFPLLKIKKNSGTFFFGLNLWFSSIFNQLMIGIDMLSFKYIFSDRELEYGYYAFCAMMTATINNLLGILVEVKGQILLEKYYNLTLTDHALHSMHEEIVKLTIEDSLIANLTVLFSYFFIVLLTYQFLPNYVPAIGVLGVLFPSIIILRWRNYFVLFLNKFNKSSYVSLSSIFGLIVFLVLALSLLLLRVSDLKYYAFLPIVSFATVNLFIAHFYKKISINFHLSAFIKKIFLTFLPSVALMTVSLLLINNPIQSLLILLPTTILYYKFIFKNDFNIVFSYLSSKIQSIISKKE